MITDRIIQYALAAALIAATAWGLWQWGQKLALQHTLDEYKIAQASLVAKAQEDYIEHEKKDVAAADAARVHVKSAVAAVESRLGPAIAAYDALASAARVRLDAATAVGAVPPGPADAGGTEGSSCDRRMAEVYRQYVPVIEAAARVANDFKSCVAGIARYRAAVDWADTP